jgi:DnaJ domain
MILAFLELNQFIMKTEPIQLDPTDFSKFISDNNLCVVRAGLEETPDFNITLNSQLNQFFKTNVSIAFINIESLNYNDAFIQSLIGERMINIGLERSDSMFPGYYLFKDSRLVGYHPGTFDISKLDPSVQKTTLWLGLAVGVLSGIATNSFASGLLTFSAVMNASTGMNIFKFFKEIMESKSEVNLRMRQKMVFLSEIDKAYALLRVAKTASEEEVKKAWKRMLVEFHPDKSKDDKEKRTKLTMSINETYEIIISHRKAAKNKFSFS